MAEEADVFSAIKEQSGIIDRVKRDSGDVEMSWDAMDAVLQQPDNRPAPQRIRSAINPERAMGVIVQLEGKETMTGALWEPDPNAQQRKKRMTARKMAEFGEKEVDQVVQNMMKGAKTPIHLYLTPKITSAYQLGGEALLSHVVIVAPRGLEWEKGKHAWLLDDIDEKEGWVVGGLPTHKKHVQTFLEHITKT
jgi:hypothetical protein